DTESRYTDAIQNLLTPYGQTYSYEVKMRCAGLPSKDSCRVLIDEFQLPIGVDELLVKCDNEVYKAMADVKLLPGVQQLLQHLHEHRIPMAIATSATRKMFNRKASPHCQLMPAFRHIVCGDDRDIVKGKPAPDIFLLAASRFKPKPSPECCLVFEDSLLGLKAGVAAGMQVVMIPDPRVPLELTTTATQVLGSMAEFQPELFGLPPYDN
ncbi:hypothetical protein KR222_004813, partial [Zaprionus bogoriensis]